MTDSKEFAKVFKVTWTSKPGEMYRITHLYADDAQDAADRMRGAYQVVQIIDIFQVIKKLDWK